MASLRDSDHEPLIVGYNANDNPRTSTSKPDSALGLEMQTMRHTVDGKQHPENVKACWGLHWRAPTTMIGFFLAGLIIAIGHFEYYRSLNDQEVASSDSPWWSVDAIKSSQEWKLRFGTAFAFVAKTTFAAAVQAAYNQRIWLTAKKKSIAIEALDAMFSATNDLLSFTSLEFITRAKLAALLAAITWLLPLSALVTPATLSVQLSSTPYMQLMPIPAVNFSLVAPLWDSGATDSSLDSDSSENGVTPLLSKLVTSTLSGAAISTMEPITPNATYPYTFQGPSFKCEKPSNKISGLIHDLWLATCNYEESGAYPDSFAQSLAWIAFPPDECIINLGDSNDATFPSECPATSWDDYKYPFIGNCITRINVTAPHFVCNGFSSGKQIPFGRFWMRAQNTSFDCSQRVTNFNTVFNASDTSQTVTHYTFSYVEQPPDQAHSETYTGIGQAMANFLSGALFSMNSGILSYSTRITETVLLGSFNTSTVQDDNSGHLPLKDIPQDLQELARGRTAGQIVEEMSRNVTLSLFSVNALQLRPSPQANVTSIRNINIYRFSAANLILAYALAAVFTLFGVAVGFHALVKNGVCHACSFSSIMASTRNPHLDDLTQGQSLGAMPMDEKLKKTKLIFGLLRPDNAQHRTPRAGFGSRHEVARMKKGVECY